MKSINQLVLILKVFDNYISVEKKILNNFILVENDDFFPSNSHLYISEASPAKMIQDWVESFEPELTKNLVGFGPKFKLEERRNCMLKLREALNHTANQVIANFKNHHTLPYNMTSHVTHTNPLLMHTIESLHKKAYGIIENYFNNSNKSQVLHCMRRKSCLKSR